MSEENIENQEVENQEEDRIKNLQSEFSRKTQNLSEELNQKLDSKMQEVIQAIQLQNQQASQSNQQSNLPNDIYDMTPQDIDRLAEEKARAMVKPLEEKLSRQEQQQQAAAQSQQVLSDYTTEFPDLNDPSSASYKAVENELKGLSVEDRLNPSKFEQAILKGLRKAPKMQSSSDDFVVGGSTSKSASKSRSKKQEVSEKTKAWIELTFGAEKLEDEEFMKKIGKNNDRKWSQYNTIIKSKKGF